MPASSSDNLVFFDLETGGLEPWRPIIQVAAIAVDGQLREMESFEAKILFDEKYAAPDSLEKNHYNATTWKTQALGPRQAARDFRKFLRRHATFNVVSRRQKVYQVAQLVAHNAAFDGPFLQTWFRRLGIFLPAHPRVLCTLQRALWVFHEDKSLPPPEDYKLGTLCDYFGIHLPAEKAHDALNDVRATVALYRELAEGRGRIAA